MLQHIPFYFCYFKTAGRNLKNKIIYWIQIIVEQK